MSIIKWLVAAVLVSILLLSGYLLVFHDTSKEEHNERPGSSENQIPAKKGVLKTFSGQQFRELYDSIAYPNSAFISEKSAITGSQEADQRITTIAEKRGYKLRSAPVTNNFVEVVKNRALQPKAAAAWRSLKKAAENDGNSFGLTEAYRSADSQKAIFLERLGDVSTIEISAGRMDERIDSILKTTAVPGYSRHHTGYTVDVSCDSDPGVLFENSACFEWLSEDNYKNAKEHGWIPSYPEGGGRQGPEPEAWEYVWAGKDILTE